MKKILMLISLVLVSSSALAGNRYCDQLSLEESPCFINDFKVCEDMEMSEQGKSAAQAQGDCERDNQQCIGTFSPNLIDRYTGTSVIMMPEDFTVPTKCINLPPDPNV